MVNDFVRKGMALFFVLIMIGIFVAGEVSAQYAVGDTVSDFSLMTTTGNTRSLYTFKGKIIVLNFFATW